MRRRRKIRTSSGIVPLIVAASNVSNEPGAGASAFETFKAAFAVHHN